MGIKDWFKGKIANVPLSDTPQPYPKEERKTVVEIVPLANLLEDPVSEVKPAKPKKPRKPKAPKKESAQVIHLTKEAATLKGQPWVSVVNVELDPKNPGAGAFELDWNDKFIASLVRAGYVGKTDQAIVDMWFQDVCRNVVLETYEQQQADPDNRQPSRKRDLGDGRVEIS